MFHKNSLQMCKAGNTLPFCWFVFLKQNVTFLHLTYLELNCVPRLPFKRSTRLLFSYGMFTGEWTFYARRSSSCFNVHSCVAERECCAVLEASCLALVHLSYNNPKNPFCSKNPTPNNNGSSLPAQAEVLKIEKHAMHHCGSRTWAGVAGPLGQVRSRWINPAGSEREIRAGGRGWAAMTHALMLSALSSGLRWKDERLLLFTTLFWQPVWAKYVSCHDKPELNWSSSERCKAERKVDGWTDGLLAVCLDRLHKKIWTAQWSILELRCDLIYEQPQTLSTTNPRVHVNTCKYIKLTQFFIFFLPGEFDIAYYVLDVNAELILSAWHIFQST